MKLCPSCRKETKDADAECPNCGLIFAKWGKIHASPSADSRAVSEDNTPTYSITTPYPEKQKSGFFKIVLLLAALSVVGYIIYRNNSSLPQRKEALTYNTAMASPAMVDLLGDTLVDADGNALSIHVLAGKTVGLYFSASWCPPCRNFTPSLVNAYNEFKRRGQPFEVVMVSFDRSQSDMMNYMKDYGMPWLAVGYENRDLTKMLAAKYSIRGIPSLVILNVDAAVVSKNGAHWINAKLSKNR